MRSAMPTVQAQRLCPEAIFVPPDFTRYRTVSRMVGDIFKRHTDLTEPYRWTKPNWTLPRIRLACRRPRLWRAQFASKSDRK